MRVSLFTVIMAGGLILGPSAAWSHHSFAAEYDANKPVTLKGKVTKVDWVNPHSWVHIDVADADGKVTNWSCETAPPNILYRQGWRRDSLKEGDEVTIDGFSSKDGSATMTARSVTMPNGRKMFAGSNTDGAPAEPKK
ncbi:MAG TPA: DUF6152 family protein [Bryobacteraceae bacterium]|jgi:hypothetical protein|nr:DUF6152 family protein [Bryobacteraceae bacterium]